MIAAGDCGLGMAANSLELGCDCLGVIHYMDAHLNTFQGEPYTIKKVQYQLLLPTCCCNIN